MPYNIDDADMEDNEDEDRDRLLAPASSSTEAPLAGVHANIKQTNINANNNYETSNNRAPHQHHDHQPIKIARNLLRHCVVLNGRPASNKHHHNNVDKSVYRWLNVRRLDRARLLVFTLCLTFVVYIVYNTLAWSTGANDRTAADADALDVELHRVIVREPPHENDDVTAVLGYLNDDLPERDASKYLVLTSGCVMPSLDPHAADVMHLFHREKYMPCSERPPLTYVEINGTSSSSASASSSAAGAFPDVRLRLNRTLLPLYNRKARIDRCCYQRIDRAGENQFSDYKWTLGHCEPLPLSESDPSALLPPDVEFVLVRCKSGQQAVYTNAHAIIRHRPQIRQRLNAFAARRQQRKQLKEEQQQQKQQQQQEQEEEQQQRTTNTAEDTLERPLSVLMLSIDSISRLNLLRAMPKTAQHMYDHGWYELQGYNKIDDNTFPNLMAIMVGYNNSLAYKLCDPVKVGKLNACPFMWTAFRRAGYVTAYGEDESAIGSFNYGAKKGFQRPPTDYYMRPYMMAAERYLPVKKRNSLTFCLGGQHSVDHVYQYAVDFAATYAGEPFFGLFWANTFSHNDLSDPSSMDGKMRDYLLQLEHRGVLNDSAVVFFSDHGLRFGAVRLLHTGWLEERLPFMFIWLPEWFRRARPDAVRALRSNRNRLTTPYDLHVWLKHVLQMSSDGGVVADDDGVVVVDVAAAAAVRSSGTVPHESANLTVSPAVPGQLGAFSCPACQSLFTTMPANRTCTDAAIEQHWCTCNAYEKQNVRDAMVLSAVRFVLQHINDNLDAYERDQKPPPAHSVIGGLFGGSSRRRCAQLEMRSVWYAGRALLSAPKSTDHVYLLVFDAKPSNPAARFEATVTQNAATGRFLMTGSVSRLNKYAGQSECMPNESLRKYCYCLTKHG